jgi:predicted dehydrogenase
MDCAATGDRPARVRKAIAAGKHIHIEKPTAPTIEQAVGLAGAAEAAGVKHGVIQDKLFLPGFAKLLLIKNAGFFGRILSIRIDAGSWIFDGKTQRCQRPSWNYKRAEGGGIALDMMAHWRYMIDRLAAPITAVCALMATAMPERVDEQGRITSMPRIRHMHCCSSLGERWLLSPTVGRRAFGGTTPWLCKSTEPSVQRWLAGIIASRRQQ